MTIKIMLDEDLNEQLASGKLKQGTAMLAQLLRNTDTIQEDTSDVKKKCQSKSDHQIEEDVEFVSRPTRRTIRHT